MRLAGSRGWLSWVAAAMRVLINRRHSNKANQQKKQKRKIEPFNLYLVGVEVVLVRHISIGFGPQTQSLFGYCFFPMAF